MHSSWSAQSPLMVDRELLLVPVTVDWHWTAFVQSCNSWTMEKFNARSWKPCDPVVELVVIRWISQQCWSLSINCGGKSSEPGCWVCFLSCLVCHMFANEKCCKKFAWILQNNMKPFSTGEPPLLLDMTFIPLHKYNMTLNTVRCLPYLFGTCATCMRVPASNPSVHMHPAMWQTRPDFEIHQALLHSPQTRRLLIDNGPQTWMV